MKIPLLASVLLLTACAGVHVKDTQVASGATHPAAIYIRPFDVSQTVFIGHHGTPAERVLRRSLAPAEFSEDLKEEMEKIAPAMVLKDGDQAPTGWVVEGEFDEVDAGHPCARFFGGPLGRSKVVIHVRISEARGHAEDYDSKDSGYGKHGHVLYEFDVAGGSRWTGPLGSVNSPGLGYATPFDYRNAAETIMFAISPDPYGYGVRSSSASR